MAGALKYITFEDVRIRLVGKVSFQDPSKPVQDRDNRMSLQLATKLIQEAEGQVEMDLSPRYEAPFKHLNGQPFKAIPDDQPTKPVLRTLCELQACMRILETDFGSGTAIDASKYTQALEKRYNKILNDSILAKFSDDYKSSKQWKFPPLPFLKRANHNSEADDGFAGMIIVDSAGEGAYPSEQINDPSQDFFDAKLF